MSSDATYPLQADKGRHRIALAWLIYPVCLVIGGIALFIVNALVWADRTVLDSGEFTSTVSGVLDEPQVQKRIGDVMAAEIVQSSDFEDRISERLPDQLAFAAPVINQQLEPALSEVSQRIIASNATAGARDAIIERLHSQTVAILEGDDTVLRTDGDALVIDLREPLDRVFKRLNRPVPPKLQERASTEIVLLDDTTGLQQASTFVRHRQEFILGFLGLMAVSFAGAIFAAPERQRGVSLVGIVVIIVGVVTLLAIFIGNRVLDSMAQDRIVLQELVHAFEHNLKLQSILLVLVGACVVAMTNPRIRAAVDAGADKVRGVVNDVGVVPAGLVVAGGLAILLFVA